MSPSSGNGLKVVLDKDIEEINRLRTQVKVWTQRRRESTIHPMQRQQENGTSTNSTNNMNDELARSEEIRLLEALVMQQQQYINKLRSAIIYSLDHKSEKRSEMTFSSSANTTMHTSKISLSTVPE